MQPTPRPAQPAQCRPLPADLPRTWPLTERQRADVRNLTARAHARAQARRFTGAPLTGFGGVA